jgi:20S proteasome alpha/beta subunit
VVLAVEKRVTSPLRKLHGLSLFSAIYGCCCVDTFVVVVVLLAVDPSSIEKIMELDSHIGCAMSGLIADARTLVDKV